MTGKGILEALSFVDETYIEEAEKGTFRRATPLVRVLLPLAACLCLAFFGLMPRSATETAPAEQQAEVGMPESIVLDKSDAFLSGENDIALDEAEMEAPSISEQPGVIVRIDEWQDNGFVASVVELPIPNLFELDSQLTVILNMNPSSFTFERRISETTSKLEDRIPTPEELPVGSIVLIQYYYYDRETETVYINWITSDLREWED